MPRGESIPRPRVGAGARGGLHGGLRPAWCDKHVLMRCQGFFQGQSGGMKAFARTISAALGGAYHLWRDGGLAGSYQR